MSAFGLVFLTREGCGLCEQTQPMVRSEAVRQGADLAVIDVDADPHLKAVYGDRVPVVLGGIAREVVVEGRFTKRSLRRALKAFL